MRIEITDSPKSEAAAAVFKRKVDCVLFKDSGIHSSKKLPRQSHEQKEGLDLMKPKSQGQP